MASKLNLLPSSTHCISLLENYTKTRSLSKIKQLHSQFITTGFLTFPSSKPFTLRSNLSSSYALCGHITYARQLFDELREPKLFLYNAIIRTYSQKGSPFEVLNLFNGILSSGYLFPNEFTYPFVVKACGDLLLLKSGSVIHGKVVAGGLGSNVFVMNSLLAMYMNCGVVGMANRVFYVMGGRDEVSWATMIGGFVKNGCASDAALMFDEMIDVGVEVNRSAVLSVISGCGDMEDLSFGLKVHRVVGENGLQDDLLVCNALIDMYARCGSINEAREVFDMMMEKDVVTWTSLIKGYILNGGARYALELCWLMHLEGVVPNAVTIVMLLQASGSLQAVKQGRCLHAWAVRRNICRDEIIETALIDMYAKCNRVSYCILVFTQSSQKRLASSNAMISAYTHNDLACDAVQCFKQMLHKAIYPDAITFSKLLCAYADLADGQLAFSVHCYLIKSGFLSENEVVRGLIDLYSKCGNVEYSHKIFGEVSLECRDITLWSALMAGYGAHGHGETAVILFKSMIQSGVEPNDVTFTCVLDAFSHAGLVDKGLELFKLMLRTCQAIPNMYHYTCMVDLLGRAGHLQEAYDLIKTMPFVPNHAVWGSLLGACMVHQNVQLGEISAKSLINIEPENTGNYVLLANIYASAGRWEDAENMRLKINDVSSRKAPGHSLVKV